MENSAFFLPLIHLPMLMKNNLELVQELLESRLDSLNEKIDINNKHIVEVLSYIKEQTTRTNGRVTILETKVNEIIINESKHIMSCPRITDIKELEQKLDTFAEENFIIKVLNRWPKQVVGVIIAGVIITMCVAAYSIYQANDAITQFKHELIEKTSTK